MILETALTSGMYSLHEAAWWTGIRAQRLRRWIEGYEWGTGGSSPPIIKADYDPIDGTHALSFHDLIEAKFVHYFREEGVSWRVIRRAHGRAAERLGTSHPFCTDRFVTDGRSIIHDTEPGLIEIATDQAIFDAIRPFLATLELERHLVARWWPLGRDRKIVVDPRRAFGRPLISDFGVPVQVLIEALKNGDPEAVADWFEIDRDSLNDVIEYQLQLAA